MRKSKFFFNIIGHEDHKISEHQTETIRKFAEANKVSIFTFLNHLMFKNSFEDLEFSRQTTVVEIREFSKFGAVECKNQGVLVGLVSQT